VPADVEAVARAWLAEDPDPFTRSETEALLAAHDIDSLEDRFGRRLVFGTAGLRGELGPGPNRMNRALVRRVAAGLARYLGPEHGRVVIGYDARHQSDEFAADTAAVLAAAGLESLLLPHPLPTPVLAYAVRYFNCGAGVMVTASHNPRRDNGYKVYLGDGAQIVPPADADISAAIDSVGSIAGLPMSDAYRVLDDQVVDAYCAGALARVPEGPRDLRIVYTPLHGVGRDLAVDLFARAGFRDVHVVAEQAEPDPTFPTTPFPNPEEPGVLDLALAAAERLAADIVLANDPDADRVAVAVGGRRLTGDEVGCLLGYHLLSSRPAAPERLVVTTIVSSSLLLRIADEFGAHAARTLTGFKWIVRPALAHPEWQFVLGYEEALGYAVGDLVRDKDGLTAALAVAELAARLKADGRTLDDARADLDDRYGAHRTAQRSFRIDPDAQAVAMARARALPNAHDLRPEADVVVIERSEGRVVFRPSGTEPKLKLYAETVDGDVDALVEAAAVWAQLA
jgi:phosphomannomutase